MEIVLGILVLFGIGAGIAALANAGQAVQTQRSQETITVGRYSFGFQYVWQNGGYDVYCTSRPANTRSSRPPLCHIYSDGKLSINSRPQRLDKAKAIARYWAEGYLDYLRTGSFPGGRRRISV